jgi:hypothetical protein
MNDSRFRSRRAAAIALAVVAGGVIGVAPPGLAAAGQATVAQSNSPSVQTVVNITGTHDTSPPTVPTGLVAIRAGYPGPTILVIWQASTDNVGVVGYEVSRDGNVFGQAPYTIVASPLTADAVTFTVRAVDGAGNRSAPASVTLPAA